MGIAQSLGGGRKRTVQRDRHGGGGGGESCCQLSRPHGSPTYGFGALCCLRRGKEASGMKNEGTDELERE